MRRATQQTIDPEEDALDEQGWGEEEECPPRVRPVPPPRRAAQDTQRVDGERVTHRPPGSDLIQRGEIQG